LTFQRTGRNTVTTGSKETGREAIMLELTVLAVPGCPNEPVLLERLAEILADRPDVWVMRRLVCDEAEAARLGMHGSPTLRINGVDPFAVPGAPASVSCRIYRDKAGRAGGAPSVSALRRALARASDSADAVGRAGLGRLAPVEGGLRAVQQRVLRAFAETGQPPAKAELEEAAAPFATDMDEVLAALHAADFLRLRADGSIDAAYPFSAVPTPHVVEIDDGPRVFSMCAIDALGIAAMLGSNVRIQSSEPGTGTPVIVRVPAGKGRAVWEPATAVVFNGQRANCAPYDPPEPAAVPSVAADVCCGYINFFTTAASAAHWAAADPEVTGQVLSRNDALRIGEQIFGPLLSTR
jgi:hypothetical protein